MNTLDKLDETMLFSTQTPEEYDQMQFEQELSKYLIFYCDDLKFGVEIGCVMEIINTFSITKLPCVPSYVSGIINLRGQIVPVMDVRERLGKAGGAKYLVVLNIQDTPLAILVDWVDRIIDLPKHEMLPVPRQNEQHLVSGMFALPEGGGAMLVLDCQQLLDHE